MMKKLTLLASLTLACLSGLAQISISFPMERQVFQRTGFNHTSNFQGDGIIRIAGNFSAEYDSIMAKVEPRVVGQGTATSWQKIHTRNGKPYYKGSISAKGGWYKLYVQSYKNGLVTDTDTIQRVGIGEVFAIAGQSNAQGGDEAVGGPVANDDRVNAVNFDSDTTYSGFFNMQPIGFSKIDDDSSSIGPFHYVPWVWAKFGDLLTDSLNVPVLFYGSAHGGTSVTWWKQAAKGEPLVGAPFYVNEALGAPYVALKVILNFYNSLTGLRAVIWHQGETDSYISENDYAYNLNQIISESRADSENSSLPWFICRVSYTAGQSYYGPKAGQDQVINNDPYSFPGPDTDNIYSRQAPQYVHFNQAGLLEFANALFNYVTSPFLENSTPSVAEDFLDLNFNCGASSVTLSSSILADKYAWSNRDNTLAESKGKSHSANYEFVNYPPTEYLRLNWSFDSTNSISASSGKYALNVRKATSEKILFSPIVDLTSITFPTSPSFTTSSAQIRPGDSVTLTGANCNGSYLWNTSATANPLVISPASTASYSVQCKTLHCVSAATAAQQVVVSSCFGSPLTLSGTVSTAQSYYGSLQNIGSTQQITSPNGKIDYKASDNITLSPGFKAESGTVFKATIEDCN